MLRLSRAPLGKRPLPAGPAPAHVIGRKGRDRKRRRRGRFCHSCISASLKTSAWPCPYCHAYLPSEGIPATDTAKRMESTYDCTECEAQVRLSETRAHLRTCEKYKEKELGDAVTRQSCPYGQCEVDEDELMDHCLAYHRWERRAVHCPICCLTPGRDPGCFSRNVIRHLLLRRTSCYEDYVVSNGHKHWWKVLDGSSEYMHVNRPNSRTANGHTTELRFCIIQEAEILAQMFLIPLKRPRRGTAGISPSTKKRKKEKKGFR
ncbi:LOW QUALITY PROTEIN: E3 ubiquitin-protein ligase RNF125 [Rhynochetos jubatus]